MVRTVTSAEMRRLDLVAQETYGIPALLLMENAGRGATDAIEPLLAGEGPVAVLCGRGNNGGDGLVIARHLHNRGVDVVVHLLFDPGKADPASDAGINLGIAGRMGLDLRVWSESPGIVPGARLVVDALLGTGLAGDVRGAYADAIRAINDLGAPVAAVDVPSGLDSDTGRILGLAVRAATTCTFALPKKGLFEGDGPTHAGRVVVIDISIPRELLA